jgi:hypothetical protein
MEFVDYEDEIPQNWFQINHTDVSNALEQSAASFKTFIRGYNPV